LPRESDLARETVVISFSDFAVAFFAGLMVFPLIFALGMQHEISGGTIGALFVALPKAFASMGLVGQFVGGAFFIALVVGALTSAISLLEVIVAAAIDSLGWARRRAALWGGAAATVVGAFSAYDIAILDFADSLATNLFLVGGGLGIALFVGWVMEDPVAEASAGGERTALFDVWRALLRYGVPAVLIFVLYHSLPETWAKAVALFAGD
jgi:NSS family neurotransmitter:Na+ symporter